MREKTRKNMNKTSKRKIRSKAKLSKEGWTSTKNWSVVSLSNIGTKCLSLSPEFSVHPKLLTQKIVNSLKQCYSQEESLHTDSIQIIDKPFPVCVVQNFLSNVNVIHDLLKEINRISFNTKKMDLYELYQSSDLSCISSPILSSFYNFLKSDVLSWMSSITGMSFTKVSSTCSVYNSTNYLLPHDDMMGDRLIAYVFYICPWKIIGNNNEIKDGWSANMGGNLQLFGFDNYGCLKYPPVTEIPPRNNQFLFFKVGYKTFHQVDEVKTGDYSRITINGWFHGPKHNADIANICNIPKINYQQSLKNMSMQDWIIPMYLMTNTKREINQQIENNSEIGLNNFLQSEKYDLFLDYLSSDDLKWVRVGPANKCNYELAGANNALMKNIYDVFSSKTFVKLLKDYTDLNLDEKKIFIEVQRWTTHCYSVIHDKKEYDLDELDVIMFLDCDEKSNAGTIIYLDPEEDEQQVLLSVYPKNNSLNLVYRTKGTARFCKYINSKMFDMEKYFYIISCKFREIEENDISVMKNK